MANDKTFSDYDVLRIIDKHLDERERANVTLALARDAEPSPRLLSFTIDYVRESGDTMEACVVLVNTVEAVIQDVANLLGPDVLEDARTLRQETLSVIDDLDEVQRALSVAAGSIPGAGAVLGPAQSTVRDIRRYLRFVAGLVGLPAELLASLDRVGMLGDELVRLIDESETIWDQWPPSMRPDRDLFTDSLFDD